VRGQRIVHGDARVLVPGAAIDHLGGGIERGEGYIARVEFLEQAAQQPRTDAA